FPARRLVQVGARMIARADRESRLLLEYVHLGAARVQLMTTLKDAAATAQHLVVPSRGGMEELTIVFVILDEGGSGRWREGAGHPDVLIIAVDRGVTSLAPLGVDIRGLRFRGGTP